MVWKFSTGDVRECARQRGSGYGRNSFKHLPNTKTNLNVSGGYRPCKQTEKTVTIHASSSVRSRVAFSIAREASGSLCLSSWGKSSDSMYTPRDRSLSPRHSYFS